MLCAVSRTICEGFRCETYDLGDKGEASYLLADMRMSCDANEYKALLVFLMLCLFAIPIGIACYSAAMGRGWQAVLIYNIFTLHLHLYLYLY